MRRDEADLVAEFLAIIAERTYVSFDELSERLRVPQAHLFLLKIKVEEQLKREDEHVQLTSRPDLDPPGFFVEA